MIALSKANRENKISAKCDDDQWISCRFSIFQLSFRFPFLFPQYRNTETPWEDVARQRLRNMCICVYVTYYEYIPVSSYSVRIGHNGNNWMSLHIFTSHRTVFTRLKVSYWCSDIQVLFYITHTALHIKGKVERSFSSALPCAMQSVCSLSIFTA